MAYEIPLQNITLVAGEDLSSHQYKAVKLNNYGKVVLAGAGENAIGILQDTPKANKPCAVMVYGVSKAVYGGTITAGTNLSVGPDGKLVAQTSTEPVVAIALENGSNNEVRTVLLASKSTAGYVNNYSILSIPIDLASISSTGDVLTEFVPGFAGRIVKVSFAVTKPTTDTSANVALNLEIGTTNVSGGVITLTHTNCATLGTVINGTPITGNNIFGNTDPISVEATVTASFSDGQGVLLIVLA